jgi:hypothetical protein
VSAASASRDTIQLEFWKATSCEGCKLIYKDNDLKDKNKLFAKNPPPPSSLLTPFLSFKYWLVLGCHVYNCSERKRIYGDTINKRADRLTTAKMPFTIRAPTNGKLSISK